MAPATQGTTITFRCDDSFKSAVLAAAQAEGRDMSDFILQAVKQRIDAVCPHCGRVDRPTAGAGLSEAFSEFLENLYKERDMQPVTVTATLGNRLVAYRGRINLNEKSQGQLLMLLDFKQGVHTRFTAEFSVPRGAILGWQQDTGHHLEHLTSIGYVNGNDAVIRAHLRDKRLQICTVRIISDAICAAPGITNRGLWDMFQLFGIEYATQLLHQTGVITGSPEGGWTPVFADPDVALQMARCRGIDVDERVA